MTSPSQPRRQHCGIGLEVVVVALAFAIVFAFVPSAQAQKYKVIHNFTGGNDGALPISTLTVDRSGDLYGTAGTVFKMTHSGSGWILTPLFVFPGGYDGSG